MLYSFNWWYIFAPSLLVLVAVVSGLRHRRHHCRPLKARYNDRLSQLVGIIATFVFAALVLIESHDGLVQLGDSTLTAEDDPAWALLVAGLALVFGVMFYYGLTVAALRLGDFCGRKLMLRRCRICRDQCRRSIAAAQNCPMQSYKQGCPVGVKFSRFSLEHSPTLMSSLRSQTDDTGCLDVPYIIKVEHPRGKVAYSTLLPHGQLQPLMQERRQSPQPRRLPNWLLNYDAPAPAQPLAPATTTKVEVVPDPAAPAKAAEPRVVFTEAGLVQQETADGNRIVSMAARRMVVTSDPKSEELFSGLRQVGD